MRSEKRKALEAAGWKFGDAADFLAMTDEGALVFCDYNKSKLNLQPLWAHAWKKLVEQGLVPQVLINLCTAIYRTSAGMTRLWGVGTALDNVWATWRPTVWEMQHFD